jgi:hypothetical protein
MKIASKGLYYTALLVGTYLVVSRATNTGRLLSSGSSAYAKAVRTLQGR